MYNAKKELEKAKKAGEILRDAAWRLDWDKAKRHFNKVKYQYLDLVGCPGVNVMPAIRLVFDPLSIRYDKGERSKQLFKEMMEVK